MNRIAFGAICIALVVAITACPTPSSKGGSSPDVKSTYTVTYDGNGSTGGTVPVDSTKYATSQEVVLATNSGNLARVTNGVTETFSGWKTGAATSEIWETGESYAMPAANTIFYAAWTSSLNPKVTFNKNEASATGTVHSHTAAAGSSITLPSSGTMTNGTKRFSAWNTKNDGSGTAYAAGASITITTPLELFAQWKTTFGVTYYGNGSSSGSVPIDNNRYLEGEAVTLRENTGNLTKTAGGISYRFAGWKIAADATEVLSSGSTLAMGTTDLKLYAAWILPTELTLTYNKNSSTATGSIPMVTFTSGSRITIASHAPLINGEGRFVIWNTNAAGTGQNYTEGNAYTLTSSLVLYAQWKPTFGVTYFGNGSSSGSVPSDNSRYIEGETLTLLANTGNLAKTVDGVIYSFAGWKTSVDATVINSAGSTLTMGSSAINFYAAWKLPTELTLTYDKNSSTAFGSIPVVTFASGASITIATHAALTNGTDRFIGWNANSAGTGQSYTEGTAYPLTTSLVLYAQWKPTYSVTYNGNGSTGGIAPAAPAIRPIAGENITVAGKGTFYKSTGGITYRFAGWALNSAGTGTIYQENASYTMGSADVVFFAVWNAPITLTYNGNGSTGGSVPVYTGSPIYPGDQITVLPVGILQKITDGIPTVFAGWAINSEGTGTIYQAGNSYTAGTTNITFYAQWTTEGTTVDKIRSFGPGGAVDFSVDLGEATTHLYLTYTNTNLTTTKSVPIATKRSFNGAASIGEMPARARSARQLNGMLEAVENPKIRDFAKDPIPFDLSPRPGKRAAQAADAVGDTETFIEYFSQYDPIRNIPSTCRYVSGTISTSAGNRSLSIWVANDCWTTGGTKTYKITQEMVNAVATKFIANGNSSIFPLATNILGAEWGAHSYSNLIPFDGNISILLCDIDSDDVPSQGSGYTAGYYSALNNYTYSATGNRRYTNERIMFALDAVMFAKPDAASAWSANGYYARQAFSTLSHELQHMIQFYQKAVVQDAGDVSETWVNEMCSMMLEDLLAEKLGLPGPRGSTTGAATETDIQNGRLATFNTNWNGRLKLPDSVSYELEDYAVGYSFGAYLLRNYGGAGLLHHIVQSRYLDETSITSAISKTGLTRAVSNFGILLSQWSVAVLGSNTTTMPAGYRYNTGDWLTTSYSGVDYKLGSINFDNYFPLLLVFRPADVTSATTFPATSNFYIQTTDTTGVARYTLTLPADVMLNVYVGN